MKTVLIYSEEFTQMEKMLDLLELSGFNSIPCLSAEDVKRCIDLTTFDLLLIGDAVQDNLKKSIKKELQNLQPGTPVFEHLGPIDNLVMDVKQALGIN